MTICPTTPLHLRNAVDPLQHFLCLNFGEKKVCWNGWVSEPQTPSPPTLCFCFPRVGEPARSRGSKAAPNSDAANMIHACGELLLFECRHKHLLMKPKVWLWAHLSDQSSHVLAGFLLCFLLSNFTQMLTWRLHASPVQYLPNSDSWRHFFFYILWSWSAR